MKRGLIFWIIIVLIILIGIVVAYNVLKNKDNLIREYGCPDSNSLNCMPSPEDSVGRGEYCMWVQENCPNVEVSF